MGRKRKQKKRGAYSTEDELTNGLSGARGGDVHLMIHSRVLCRHDNAMLEVVLCNGRNGGIGVRNGERGALHAGG